MNNMKQSDSFSLITPTQKRWGTVYLLLNLLLFPTLLPFCLELILPNSNAAVKNFLYFSISFLLVLGIFRNFLWESAKQLGNRPISLFVTVLFGLSAYFLLGYQVAALISWFRPDFSNVNDNSIQILAKQNFPVMAVGTVLLVPVTEECLYRGLMFGGLFQKSPVLAYLISTVLFSAIHILGYIGSYDAPTLLICMVQYLPAGICLGWAYQKSGNMLR